MTTYRVGEQGATVWSADGRLLGSLPAGVTIVAGVEDVAPPAELPERIADAVDAVDGRARREAQRMRGYADKVIRPERDTGI